MTLRSIIDLNSGIAQVFQIWILMVLRDFKLELQFLAAKNGAEIELPELTRESKPRPVLIEIHNELQTECTPQVCQRNVRPDRFQLHFGVERKELASIDEAIEGIAVEVIAVRRIGRPVRIGIMRRGNPYSTAALGNAMQLRDESHDVGYVLGDMAADHFVELIIFERIGKDTQIVDYIGVGPGIGIHADGARRLVPATADVKNSLCRRA